MKRSKHFRQLLASGQLISIPGAFDAITAKLIEQTGFPAVYVTGSGVSLSLLAQPDLNTVSYSELKTKISELTAILSVPLVVDIDTGFGGPLNLIRLTREFEQLGVAAVQIEDQRSPKRCGHELGRHVVSCEEMISRIRAIADHRNPDDGLVIIARTDARTTLGIDEAIRRGNLYFENGADVVFIESPESEEEVRQIGREVKAPVLFNNVEGGRSPFLTRQELIGAGFSAVIYPNSITRIVTRSCQRMLASLKETGTTEAFWGDMVNHKELWALFSHDEWVALESKYAFAEEGGI